MDEWVCSAPVRELAAGTLMVVVYYEEGRNSAVRAKRFRLTAAGLEPLSWW